MANFLFNNAEINSIAAIYQVVASTLFKVNSNLTIDEINNKLGKILTADIDKAAKIKGEPSKIANCNEDLYVNHSSVYKPTCDKFIENLASQFGLSILKTEEES